MWDTNALNDNTAEGMGDEDDGTVRSLGFGRN